MLQIILLLNYYLMILLPGVLSGKWNVNYPGPICAVRGSNVTIPCTFTYPSVTVTRVLWCLENLNHNCMNTPNVYDSEVNNNQINYHYIGDKKKSFSLLISNINRTDSGEYRFRFTSKDNWTGDPGVEISVYDLRVSMTTSRENGSTAVGDALNLTCKLKCSGNLAEVQWFKNGDLMQQTKPVLTFNSVTAKDSGNYSCSLKNVATTISEEYGISIEDVPKPVSWSPESLIIVSVVIFIIAAVMLLRRKAKAQRKAKTEEGTLDSLYITCQKTADTQASAVYSNLQETTDEGQEDEVQYASVNIQPKEVLQMSADTEQQNDSTIYSTIK